MDTATFPGRYESLAKVSKFVVQAAHQAGLNDEATYAVELAVDEACSNIIDHAYGGENIGVMQCSVIVSNGELTIILRDYGAPFNPDSVAKPKINVPLKDIKPRGLGIYFMRKLMDEVHYETTQEAGNVLTMVKRA